MYLLKKIKFKIFLVGEDESDDDEGGVEATYDEVIKDSHMDDDVSFRLKM